MRATEMEMKQICEQYQASDEASQRSNLRACIKHLSEKLRTIISLWERLGLRKL